MKKYPVLYLFAVLWFSMAGCTCGAEPEVAEPATTSGGDDEKGDAAVQPNLPKVPTAIAEPAKVSSPSGAAAGKMTAPGAETPENRREKWANREKEIASSPFEVSIESAYLSGRCARGPVPEERSGTGGITARMRGKLTYTGKDLLLEATIAGALVIDMNGTHLVEIPFRFSGGKKTVTALSGKVRGADPWVAGQSRDFTVESMPISEAYCEFVPQSAKMHVAVQSLGVVDGEKIWPVTATPFHFEEVVGMALGQQVQIRGERGLIPADGHVAMLDRILITRLDGTTEWVRRADVAYLDGLVKASGVSFPQDIKTDHWKISVKDISSAKTFGDITANGDDEFLALVELTMTNLTGEQRSADEIRVQLEAAPNQWRKPLGAGPGRLANPMVDPSGTLKTTAVFTRYRFERPIRLRVESAGSSAMDIDVFSYSMGPERSPL